MIVLNKFYIATKVKLAWIMYQTYLLHLTQRIANGRDTFVKA